ncbi:hypothetical protein A0J61_00405 [Choanephora cucurbitarum]|uniref:Ndc10 domain-containing protein n=1 Tax=Choanephora cucurbitarum TaxID=101091 RepID=A0A1C7NRF8_9FUNG|nr:hypothetical protein A0J61_00405 [Choanephora cucurbitarum]
MKLAFLLNVAAFLRPSDLARMPLASCTVAPDRFTFQVVSPKETSGCRSIIKNYAIHLHRDSSLCPGFLLAFFGYKATTEITTLRSLGSSAALDKDISKDTLVALGNWSQSQTFENYYQRSHMLQMNFASTLMSIEIDNLISLDLDEDKELFEDTLDPLDQQ